MTKTRSLKIDGKHVRDAAGDIVVTVKPVDIRRADKKDPTCCVVALAAQREQGVKAARIHVSKSYLLHSDNIWRRYNTPQSLRQEIVAFDRGGKFQPGDYTLQKPSGTTRLGAARGGKVKTKIGRKRRRTMHLTNNVREVGPRPVAS